MATSLDWGNAMASLRWLHTSGALTLRQCAYYTRYDNRLELSQAGIFTRICDL